MGKLRITKAELARNIHAVLAKVEQVAIEQDHHPVAIVHSPLPKGRLLSECIALAEARSSTATLDEGFMKDVEEGIARRRQSWNPPSRRNGSRST